ncbi:MAG: preprotein translocase subunit YajC [Gammaproteobacteria bacterium]|nr:MAG: preprotein translocase subunit YajC [Gammaproteobacteria bacterium]
MDFFISKAYANSGTAAGGDLTGILMIVVLGLAMYFLMIRPQQKKLKEHKKLLENLNKGDEIVTSGGILGKITNVGDNFVTVNIGNDIEIKLQKPSVSAVLPKGTIKSA